MASGTFNAASYFIDRHLEEGRGAAVAIECGDRRITYQQLHDEVNRVGNVLRYDLGILPEQRVLFLAADDRLNYEGVLRIIDLAKSGVEDLKIEFVAAQ